MKSATAGMGSPSEVWERIQQVFRQIPALGANGARTRKGQLGGWKESPADSAFPEPERGKEAVVNRAQCLRRTTDALSVKAIAQGRLGSWNELHLSDQTETY